MSVLSCPGSGVLVGVYFLLILQEMALGDALDLKVFSALGPGERWSNLRSSLQAPNILLPPSCRVRLMGPEKPSSLISVSKLMGCGGM